MADKIKEQSETTIKDTKVEIDAETMSKTIMELNEAYKKLNEYENKFKQLEVEKEKEIQKLKETKNKEIKDVVELTKEASFEAIPGERQPWEVLDNIDGDLVETEEYFVNK